jgi:hypothetical protein
MSFFVAAVAAKVIACLQTGSDPETLMSVIQRAGSLVFGFDAAGEFL